MSLPRAERVMLVDLIDMLGLTEVELAHRVKDDKERWALGVEVCLRNYR